MAELCCPCIDFVKNLVPDRSDSQSGLWVYGGPSGIVFCGVSSFLIFIMSLQKGPYKCKVAPPVFKYLEVPALKGNL